MTSVDVDVAIFGGGITGMWLLARLRKLGYNAWLFEKGSLGGVQSIASQGIIHGGTKYALTGKLGKAAQSIGEMPQRWQQSLSGDGELDLSEVKILSQHQYLWSSGSLTSDLAGFFAGKMMRSRVGQLKRADYPAPFSDTQFKGRLYQLMEPVLDVPSLFKVLTEQVGQWCVKIQGELRRHEGGELVVTGNDDQQWQFKASAVVLSAGAGNEAILEDLDMVEPQMQRRPLHMVLLEGPLPAIFAHCLGPSALPRVTITSYPLGDDRQVWYLGGQLAEEGVDRTVDEQIEFAKSELGELLPWLQLEGCIWETLRVDRAEQRTTGGSRPDDFCLHRQQNVMTVWPTKLAYAPRVTDAVLDELHQLGVVPGANPGYISEHQAPNIAHPPWERES
ncbi:MAG: FAD-dependent oxidoreductase [bacterium]